MYSLPQEIIDFVKNQFSECNSRLSHSLSRFPGIREETLDNNFIAYFSEQAGAVTPLPNWTVRFEAHFMGGGRHFKNWEVSDIGLMVIFRKRGKIIRSKMVFLQSKKLYASGVNIPEEDMYGRMGMGKLLDTDEEHHEKNMIKELSFTEKSRYKAFKKENEQQLAMSSFQRKFGVDMYYLFYNPVKIPHSIRSPYENDFPVQDNLIGCRVVKKDFLDSALKIQPQNHVPTYGDIKYMLEGEFLEEDNICGWRFEHFVVDLFMGCKEGLIDDSPNFETLMSLLYQKSNPISAALSITVDLDGE